MENILRPLKRFGQNFLIDNNIIAKMLDRVAVSKKDCVLEVGPGRGALTVSLAKRCRKVIAVELDRGLCRQLSQDFKADKRVAIHCCDILKFDVRAHLRKAKTAKVVVVANLPYYITTPIIEYFFKNIACIDDIYITIQKEVALRMMAIPKTKEYGSFTCFVNYYCRPSILFKIKKDSFWPVPKVDSCFVRLKPYASKERPFKVKDEELFFRVVRSAFGQRRKQLLNPLSGILEKSDLKSILGEDILSRRAEELSLEDYAVLSNLIFEASRKSANGLVYKPRLH